MELLSGQFSVSRRWQAAAQLVGSGSGLLAGFPGPQETIRRAIAKTLDIDKPLWCVGHNNEV